MTCPKHGSQIEEQRIALVLNGGISLAVWMSGVVNEISSLTRLSHDEELTRNPHSAAVWKSILEKTPRRCLRVDLIAGTSAGGLNGAFLAHAIANQRELFDMRNIWVQQAKLDTSHLLNPEPAQAAWALNGEFFGRAIRDQMQGSLDTPRSSGPPPTITLLTTATAINDDPIPSRDDVEAEYSYRDSRRVYAFRQRGWRPGDTELTDEATLALAARASASYPVAFQPVSETAELGARRIQGRGDSGLLMDGGVLDNAPFEPLLAELRSMPINGWRKRHLLYVTPDLGKLESAASVAVDWLSELRQVWSIMREGDTRLDEDALRQARDDSSYEASIPHKVLIKWLDNPGTEIDIDPNLFQQYRAGRFEAFYRWLEPEPGSSYDVPDGLIPAEPVTAADRPGFELDAGGANWSWGLSVAQRISNWLGRAAAERPHTEESGEALAQAFEAVQALQQNVADRFESFTSAVDCERRWRAVADFYGNVELRAELGGLLRAAADAVGAVYGSERVLEFALRLEVLTNTWSWAMPDGRDAPRFEYRRITPAEDPPFSDPFFEDTGWQARKLYGQQWAAFGAFATADAREHDWLWGRLDGAMALVEVLYAGSDGTAEELADAKRHLVDAILLDHAGDDSAPANAPETLRNGLVEDTQETVGVSENWRRLYERLSQASPEAYAELKQTLFGLLSNPKRLENLRPYAAVALREPISRPDRALLKWYLRLRPLRGWIGRKVDQRLQSFLRVSHDVADEPASGTTVRS